MGSAIRGWRAGKQHLLLVPRQSDLAQAAQLVGFGWSEPIVARVEAGTRALSLGEGMALATILTTATMVGGRLEETSWTDLAVEVEVGDGLVIPASAMPTAVQMFEDAPAGWRPDFVGPVDHDIARRAELPAEAVQRAAVATWGHTATAEEVLNHREGFDLLTEIAPAINELYDALGVDRRLDAPTTARRTDDEACMDRGATGRRAAPVAGHGWQEALRAAGALGCGQA